MSATAGGVAIDNVTATVRRTTISGNTAFIGGGCSSLLRAGYLRERHDREQHCEDADQRPAYGGGVYIYGY